MASVLGSAAGIQRGQRRALGSCSASSPTPLGMAAPPARSASHPFSDSMAPGPSLHPPHWAGTLGNTAGTASLIPAKCLTHGRTECRSWGLGLPEAGAGAALLPKPPPSLLIRAAAPLLPSLRPSGLRGRWTPLDFAAPLSHSLSPTVTWALVSHPVRTPPPNSSKADQCHSDQSHGQPLSTQHSPKRLGHPAGTTTNQ